MFDIPPPVTDEAVKIHPTATVEPGAELGRGVEVGPYAYVGARVKLHDGVRIGRNVIVEGDTTVGERTVVYPFATLGSAPQDLKYRGEETSLVIGKENSIRQYVNLSLGTEHGGGVTRIGDRNLFMVYTHIGHDSIVGDGCVLANGVSLAGHVRVDSHAIIGGHAAVHQFCRVGERAIAAGGAMITQDVPPYCMVHGNRAAVVGLNVVGLKRAGFGNEDMAGLKKMFRLVFKDGLTLEEAIERIEAEVPPSAPRETFLEFLRSSERGLCR